MTHSLLVQQVNTRVNIRETHFEKRVPKIPILSENRHLVVVVVIVAVCMYSAYNRVLFRRHFPYSMPCMYTSQIFDDTIYIYLFLCSNNMAIYDDFLAQADI